MGGLFKSSKQTSSTQVNLPDWADRGLERTSERALGLMDRPYEAYTGQRVAGVSDWTTQGAGAVQGAAGFQPGQVQAGTVSADRVRPGSVAQTNLRPYLDPFQDQVIDAALADIDRGTRVAQAGRTAGGVMAAGFGGFGDRSAVAGAEIERAGLDAKARTAAGLRSQGFQRAQDMATADINRDAQAQTFNAQTGLQAGLANQQAGLGAQQFNVSSGLQGAQQRAQAGLQLAGMGELERGVRQQGLDAAYGDFRERRDDPFLKTQWTAGVIGGNAGPYAGNTTSTTPGPSPFSQLVGGATAAAGLFGMFSDPEDKTDKRRLGTDPATGLGIWAYRYKGDSKRNPKVVGVMADEVEERYPHLVRRVNGHRVVDMGGLAAVSGGEAGFAEGGLSGGDRSRFSPRWMARQPLVERSVAPALPPIIDGVAEPVPMTDAWTGTPAVAGMGAGAPMFSGEAAGPEELWGGAAAGEGVGGTQAPRRMDPAGAGMDFPVGEAGGEIRLSPSVEAALSRIRGAQQRAPSGTSAAAGGARPPALPARADMPSAMPLEAPGASRGATAVPAAARAEEGNFFARLGRRFTDPNNAGSLALMEAGLAMMASRNPNWAGAIGEGALVGARSAREAMPLVRQRQEAEEAQRLFAGMPDASVSAPMPPRRRAGAPAAGGAGPVRMTSVAVPSLADRVATAETGGRDDARNPAPGSSASGALQITDALWSDYAPRLGLTAEQRTDRGAQRAVFDAFEADMRRDLPGVLGREPSDADIYAAWGLGAAGFRALAGADPGADAMEVYSRAAGPERARQAFAQNGRLMRPGMTAGEVLEAWRGRLPGGSPAAPRSADPGAAGAGGAASEDDAWEAEPTIQIGGRSLNRAQLLSIAASAPSNPNVQRMVGLALPALNQEIARREAALERRQARQDSADLRRELAGRGREPQPTELSRLIAERDALPPGDPRRASYDAAIRRASGEAAAERFTPAQIVQLRRDAFNAARQEAGGLDFETEADRSGWIDQRARQFFQEWGVPEAMEPARGGGDPVVRSGTSGRPEAQDAAPDNGARIRPRREDPMSRPLTETQAKANMFGLMMENADRVLSGTPAADGRPEERGVPVPSDAAIAAWRNLPDGVSNLFMSTPSQRYFNAVRLFAAGILRKETGAAFTANELLDVQSRFFPMPGDSAETIAQKAEARRLAIEAMQAEVPGGFRRGVQPLPGQRPAQGGGQRQPPASAPAPRPQPNSLERFMPGGG